MELRDFVDEELYPAIWDRLATLFPEMEFKYELGKWRSRYKLDGTTKTGRKDKVVVTAKLFHVALENGGGDAKGRAKDLITLYMDHNSLSDRIEAIRQIAKSCNLTIPEGADAEKWEEARRRREEITLSYNRQREALFSPGGAEVLRYLKEVRGYSEELIKEMGLGYISPDEARNLEEKCKVGIAWKAEEYPLSIPYFSRGNIIGFKFRYITPLEGKSKYMNTRSLGSEGMDSNPFGLTPQSLSKGDKKAEVIVVEGELDALHAIALGLPNVIAVAGGKITDGKARALKNSGYKNVVILLDMDAAGQKFTEESIFNIDQAGLNSFVATLPDAKDTDEYLKKHSIGELKEVIKGSDFGGLWLYFKERERYENSQKGNIDLQNFLDSYVNLASRHRDPIKRERLLSYLRRDLGGTDIEETINGVKEKVEASLESEERESSKRDALSTLRLVSSTIANGDGTEPVERLERLQDALDIVKAEAERKVALKTIGEKYPTIAEGKASKTDIDNFQVALNTLKRTERETDYSLLLEDNTEDLYRQYRESQVGLPSRFILKHRENKELEEYSLLFPSGAISLIGAPTGHGKSKVLQSIALDALDSLEEGETILFISYEENELSVNKSFLNAYANETIKPQGAKGSNLSAITHYLNSGDPQELREDKREYFLTKETEWNQIRASRKIKIVKPEDNYLETLLSLIKLSVKYLKVKAILIDYVQEIYVRDWSKYSRTDELKEAMVRLDAIAQKTYIPIIMGAQLRRETNSPLDLYNQAIADSAWIERKCSEIVLIWSNKEGCKGENRKDTLSRIEKEIELDLGEKLDLGTSGKLYVRLTKSRVIPSGSHAIVPIKGSTGRVGETKKRGDSGTQIQIFHTQAPGQRTTYDDNVKIDTEAQRPYREPRHNEEEGENGDLPF